MFFLAFCKTNKTQYLLDGLKILPPTNAHADTEDRKVVIAEFIEEMSKLNDVRWTDAFSGKKSAQVFTFERFSKWARINELLTLADNENTIVRVYAFLCLKTRKNIDLKSIALQHLQDTAYFTEVYGCIGNSKRINEYFFEETIGYFSAAEIAKYRKAIAMLNSRCKY